MKQLIAIVLACLTVSMASAGDLADDLGLIELDAADMSWAEDLKASDFDFMTPELTASMLELSDSIRAEQSALLEAQVAQAAYERQMAEMTKMLRDNAPVLREIARDLKPAQSGGVSDLLRASEPAPSDARVRQLLDLGEPAPTARPLVAPSLKTQRAQDPTGTSIFDSLKMD